MISTWIHKLLYQAQATRQGFREHGATLLLSLAAVTFTLLLLASYLLFLNNLGSMEARLGENLQITAYLDKAIPDERRRSLEASILAVKGVDSVRFVSAGESLASLKKALGESSRALEGLEENPLPPSLEIRVKKEQRELSAIRALAEEFSALAGVTEVEYGGEWIARFFAVAKILRWVGVGLGFLLLGATVIVISSTLTLGFFARKEEIEILRLVGATEAHVRFPFFLEAMFQGMGGALLAVAALWVLFQVFRLNLEGSWSLLAGWGRLGFLSPLSVIGLVLLGAAVGVVSTILCFSRFSSQS